jgi:hypothetical protein
MLLSIGLLVLFTSYGALAYLLVNRRCSHWESPYRIAASLVPAGLGLVALCWFAEVLNVTSFDWNQARLAPLFGLRYGYSLYYPPETGPVMGAIYGPISYLAYFPTLLAHTPVPALLIGAFTATIYFIGPVIAAFISGPFRRGQGLAVGLFLLVAFFFWTAGDSSLRYCCFNIHADAPAIGFAAAACVLLMRRPEPSAWILAAAALFTALAVFSKQSVIFVVPVAAAFLWVADGRRFALRFLALFGALLALMFGGFAAVFSTQALYFNLYGFPSHHGFGDLGYMRFPEPGVAFALKVLVRTARRFWDFARWLILLSAICYMLEFHLNHHLKMSIREWIRNHRWILFHCAAIGGLPFALIFGSKVGASENAFGPSIYFGLTGLLLLIGHLVLNHREISSPVLAACAVLVVTLVPGAGGTFDFNKLIQNLKVNHTEQVYEYDKNNPGQTYFSFFPLSVLMAEGSMVHFEYGVFDRELGGAPVTRAHFMQYIPPHPQYVQRTDQDSPILEYLPQFACPVGQPPIAGLSFYRQCGTSASK